jgi:hypothetical protein
MNAIDIRALDDLVESLRASELAGPTLEERIIDAHNSGDLELLERLQGQYRQGDLIRVSPPPSLKTRSGTGAPTRSSGSGIIGDSPRSPRRYQRL